MTPFVRASWFGLLLVFALPAWAESVSLAGPGRVRLRAEYLPPKEGSFGAPAVVLLHGCEGMWQRGRLGERYAHMAGLFQELGYAVLIPDSFGPRGVREQCRVPPARQRVSASRRADDAQWAVAWLRQQPAVDAGRIGTIGWSHGGTAALKLAGRQTEGLQVAAAFYPNCTPLLRQLRRFQARVPSLILMGESDDWSLIAPCRKLAERDERNQLHLVGYPLTYQDFDVPGSELRVRRDVPDGQYPGQGVTLGANPEAAADAYRRLFKWFARTLDRED
ncbi:dienelactone hydrolase family protein [Chitiniphilus purpureus]|uniref:Dienelactone hydrolase family protein n=1 Tax=Chitiniphilus purpureus TaxID=2981137 RepID=A0ABY6DRS4_9NEIS|nr:dienelactone hydrolase family protein [Chitiniphilus sp. CD1]UXY17067.1 dienelactone hydrolase family protein [Chitiniphilus sp. CD1]